MNKYIKFVIAGLMIIGGIFLILNREGVWGGILITLSVIPIFLFFRNEFMLIAFYFIRKQNLTSAQKWLNKITNPESQLFKKQLGYFNYLNGICCSQENNINKAEIFMKKALQLGLTFDHDKALASINLAAAYMSRGKKLEAEKYLADAKKFDKSNMLGDQIKMMKEKMKKVNVGQNLQNPNMRNRGKFF